MPNLPHHPRGMTLAELLIGMAVTSMVMAALATMTYGVANGWKSSDGTQVLQIQGAQVYDRVRYYLASAKYIAQVTPGSLDGSAAGGSVFFWATDSWLGLADGAPQSGEMALIQHDPATGILWLYYCKPYSQLNAIDQTAAGTTLTNADIISNGWPAGFILNDYTTKKVLGRNVKGAKFAVDWTSSTTQRPVVEFTLVLSRPPQPDITQYDTALLRSPTTQPD